VDIRGLQATWDALGSDDPLGVILGYPERRNEWDAEEFFRTGEAEIDAALARAARFGLPERRGRALDFGCGVGRLTQAMCRHFELVDGVDIAPSMIAAADRLNRQGERCRYHLNDSDSLAFLDDETFDFVYSALVLQHMAPELARRYLAELVRVLRPGGLLVFQVPAGRIPQAKLPRSAVLAEIRPLDARLELEAGAEAAVRARVRNAGAAPWPALLGGRPVHLGNHWRAAGGALLQLDDGRAPLPHDVQPGEEVEIELTVTTPIEPGEYLLELDLVQEGVAWFSQRRRLSRRRSRTARVPFTVVASRAQPTGDGSPTLPHMEMHAVPRRNVERILRAGGARLLEATENDAAGPGWISLTYTATKAAR
jgi:SAM-dependent methyltransferase